ATTAAAARAPAAAEGKGLGQSPELHAATFARPNWLQRVTFDGHQGVARSDLSPFVTNRAHQSQRAVAGSEDGNGRREKVTNRDVQTSTELGDASKVTVRDVSRLTVSRGQAGER